MKRPPILLMALTALLVFGSSALAQANGDVFIPGEPPPPLLEVTEDGTLIYDGDVVIACKDVGSGIVVPGADSRAVTRKSLERTNERAIEMCTEAGFPPSGTESVVLPDTGGGSLAGFAAVWVLTGYILIRRALR